MPSTTTLRKISASLAFTLATLSPLPLNAEPPPTLEQRIFKATTLVRKDFDKKRIETYDSENPKKKYGKELTTYTSFHKTITLNQREYRLSFNFGASNNITLGNDFVIFKPATKDQEGFHIYDFSSNSLVNIRRERNTNQSDLLSKVKLGVKNKKPSQLKYKTWNFGGGGVTTLETQEFNRQYSAFLDRLLESKVLEKPGKKIIEKENMVKVPLIIN
jgi:hypothetical protein